MALFSMNADLDIVSLDELRDVIQIFTTVAMYNAVRAYLNATLSRIPVRTGFLRGSFQNLQTYFNAFGASFLQGSQPKPFEFYYPPGGSRILKTRDSGIQFNTPPEQVITVQGDTINAVIDADINYYAINDFGHNIHTAGWGSIEAGSQALYNVLEQELNNFPNVDAILSTFRIRVSESNIITTTIPADVSSRTLILRAFF